MTSLTAEAAFWNREYKTLYGKDPDIGHGSPMVEVHRVQSAVMRHYVEEMKKVINEHNIQRAGPQAFGGAEVGHSPHDPEAERR
jgi:hypothetical protein